jgi:putative PIN family toxin of toxin-antitoxin system
MAGPLVILDTNVLVAATRSRRGASFALLSRIGGEDFRIAVSVPLVLEYEYALLNHRKDSGLSESEVGVILDYLCSTAERQEIFFLWRPSLRDPKDDMVLELAVAAEAAAIVTHNTRDFVGASEFGVEILTPPELLTRLRGNS